MNRKLKQTSMKLYIFGLLLIVSMTGFSQDADTTWFDRKWEETSRENGIYMRVQNYDSITNRYKVKDYYQNGSVQMSGSYSSMAPEVKDGLFVWYHKNGSKITERYYENNRPVQVSEYNDKGEKIREGLSAKDDNGVYTLKEIEEAPSFPGGIPALRQFMASNTRYPEKAKNDSISGKVIVSFVVSPTGKITNTKVQRSVHPLLDEEALRVVQSMPRWKPGKQDGKAVPVMYGVPFNFKL